MNTVPNGVAEQTLSAPVRDVPGAAQRDVGRGTGESGEARREGMRRHSVDPMRDTDRYRLATPYIDTRAL